MLVFVLTTYRTAALIIGLAGVPVTLIAVFIAARALGGGGQAADDGRMSARERKITLIIMAMTALVLLHLLVGLFGHLALDRASQPITGVSDILIGQGYDPQRLLSVTGGFLVVSLVGAVAVGIGLQDGGPIREFVQGMFTPSTHRGESGSAHLATPAQFTYLQHLFLRPDDAYGLTIRGEFYGIRSPNDTKRRIIRVDKTQGPKYRGMIKMPLADQTRGMALIGPPGAGKSQGGILPIAAETMRTGQSLIILDPQNELERYIVDFCRVTGHTLIVHDPTDPTTHRYNLVGGLTRPEDAQSIASMIIKGTRGDPFWSNSARNLLAACMFVFDDLGQILQALTDMKQLADRLEAHPIARGLAATWINDARQPTPRTAPGILSQMTAGILANWSTPHVQQATSTSDFGSGDLIKRPSVLILRCPGKYMNVYGPYLGAVLERLLNELEDRGAQSADGKLPRPVKIIIDELPVLGKADAILKSVNTVRKRDISFVVALQSKAQLDIIYGADGANTLLTGFAIKIIYGGTDKDTAYYASQLGGKSTIHVETQSRGVRTHVNVHTRGRDLLTPDEVMRPTKGNSTVFYPRAKEDYAEQMVFFAAIRRMYRLDWWQRQIAQTHRDGIEPTMLPATRTAGALFTARVETAAPSFSKRELGGYDVPS